MKVSQHPFTITGGVPQVQFMVGCSPWIAQGVTYGQCHLEHSFQCLTVVHILLAILSQLVTLLLPSQPLTSSRLKISYFVSQMTSQQVLEEGWVERLAVIHKEISLGYQSTCPVLCKLLQRRYFSLKPFSPQISCDAHTFSATLFTKVTGRINHTHDLRHADNRT